jgi:glycosyl transferase family 25
VCADLANRHTTLSRGRDLTKIPTFVINLDRSVDRWKAVSESGERAGLAVERVPAVDAGSLTPPFPALDEEGFMRFHGRKPLPGEYGCYRSHLAALSLVADGEHDVAMIAEDDVLFEPDVEERVCRIMAACPGIELLKLVNHRGTGFIASWRTGGDELGRCMLGPLGSSACYAVTKSGAKRLLDTLKTMWLPYDAAFERGWSTGVATYTVRKPLVTFQPLQAETTIAARIGYAKARLPAYRRLPVLLFRARDHAARATYALQGKTKARNR